MTNEEILKLMDMNSSRYQRERECLYNEFISMNNFIHDKFKENAVHRHFKTKKEARAAMAKDFNPFNTFSYGEKDPTLINLPTDELFDIKTFSYGKKDPTLSEKCEKE